jgi:glycosyltransferase involved in cell wall biosynthesis
MKTLHNIELSILYINAINVHEGGGAKLLRHLMEMSYDKKTIFLLDTRLDLSKVIMGRNVHSKFISPTIKSRILSELWLSKTTTANDTIICFGNLPPLFIVKAKVVVFLQNRYLIDKVSLAGFKFFVKLRLLVERVWFRSRINAVDKVVVQTLSMKVLLSSVFPKNLIMVAPFFPSKLLYKRSLKATINKLNSDSCFLYVASGDPHKNHINLIHAWCLLADEGIFPQLILTIESRKYTQLCDFINENISINKLHIKNIYKNDTVNELYEKADALIYPSLLESFGIPIIEARSFNLPVLASELDYVRDSIDPEESFDPKSPVSISRAVKRFMGHKTNHVELTTGVDFINLICN